jgi:hypothetical protein
VAITLAALVVVLAEPVEQALRVQTAAVVVVALTVPLVLLAEQALKYPTL